MSDFPIPPRPPTPQVLLHRQPDKPESPDLMRKPSKYIILIMGPTAVAGKLQIARSVANVLSCPLYQGDSIHDSSAKAASVGSSRVALVGSTTAIEAREPVVSGTGRHGDGPNTPILAPISGPNEDRYRRMWLSKLTRTGLLFPEESRPATEGFSGFGGKPTSTSRKGSASSVASMSSGLGPSSSVSSGGGEPPNDTHPASPMTPSLAPHAFLSDRKIALTLSKEERLRRDNPALMVLTHPDLEAWHKLSIRTAVGDYGIGVIFVPLYKEREEREEDEGEVGRSIPNLRLLDPTTMKSFPTPFDAHGKTPRGWGGLDEEIRLRVDVNSNVEGKVAQIMEGVNDVMGHGKIGRESSLE